MSMCLRRHNRCSFNGLSLSMQEAALWHYKDKMDTIPDESLCVFGSTFSQTLVGVLDVRHSNLVISTSWSCVYPSINGILDWMWQHDQIYGSSYQAGLQSSAPDEVFSCSVNIFAKGRLAAAECGWAFEDAMHLNEVCLSCCPQQGNHHSSFCSPAVSYQLWQPALSSLHLSVARCWYMKWSVPR